MGRIIVDEEEFLKIVRGKWRKDLQGFIRRGQIKILGPGRGVAIPVETILIPRFHFMPIPEDAEINNEDGDGSGSDISPDLGVGEGDGDIGKDLGPIGSDEGDGEGDREAGTGRGIDVIEIEIPAEDFYELFKESLELPNIKPKGEKQIRSEAWKYTDIRTTGPDSLRHKKRTYKEALKRTISEGKYDPDKPVIIPIRPDMRFRMPELITKPKNNAVIFNMMDVSGSMSREDRAVVRYFCALCEFWLSYNYDQLEIVWIIHDGEADRVSKDVFFRTQRGGGTVISSAHKLFIKTVDEEYPASQWNIYPMYFSDGFNIGDWDEGDDNEICARLIKDEILGRMDVNQYSYCEVDARRFWMPSITRKVKDVGKKFRPAGSFGEMLVREFNDEPLVVCANLQSMDGVPDAIKEVFGRGN